MIKRKIDQFDGCVYDCLLYPGVWSDWCALQKEGYETCDRFVKITKRYVWCKE